MHIFIYYMHLSVYIFAFIFSSAIYTMITANDARISKLDDSNRYINLHTNIYTTMGLVTQFKGQTIVGITRISVAMRRTIPLQTRNCQVVAMYMWM